MKTKLIAGLVGAAALIATASMGTTAASAAPLTVNKSVGTVSTTQVRLIHRHHHRRPPPPPRRHHHR